MQLGRLGVWYPVDRLSAQQLRDLVVRVERLGYDALWYPESRGYESFSVAGYMLGCSQKLKLGSSIASIYARDAFTAARGAMTLNAMYGERFVLGLGVSHAPMVEKIRGHTYQKPVPQMREYPAGRASRSRCRHPPRHCGPRPADAQTGRRSHARRAAVQHHTGTHA